VGLVLKGPGLGNGLVTDELGFGLGNSGSKSLYMSTFFINRSRLTKLSMGMDI